AALPETSPKKASTIANANDGSLCPIVLPPPEVRKARGMMDGRQVGPPAFTAPRPSHLCRNIRLTLPAARERKLHRTKPTKLAKRSPRKQYAREEAPPDDGLTAEERANGWNPGLARSLPS